MCSYTLVYVQACVYMYVYTCGGSSTMCAWVAVMVVSTWWSISLVCIIFFEEVVCSSSLLSGLRLIARIACLWVDNVVSLSEEKGRKGVNTPLESLLARTSFFAVISAGNGVWVLPVGLSPWWLTKVFTVSLTLSTSPFCDLGKVSLPLGNYFSH